LLLHLPPNKNCSTADGEKPDSFTSQLPGRQQQQQQHQVMHQELHVAAIYHTRATADYMPDQSSTTSGGATSLYICIVNREEEHRMRDYGGTPVYHQVMTSMNCDESQHLNCLAIIHKLHMAYALQACHACKGGSPNLLT
jgi:hypothetical protein